MNLESFSENFELLTDAPNAVVKLREIILQLAVRGKLVPQDPNDEPVSILLERMKAEKEELILNRTIVRDTSLPPIQKNEIPFNPGGWQWERLGNLARFIDYRGKTPPKTESGIKLITAKNVRMGFIKNEPEEYISEATYQDWMTRGFPKYGDILFTTEAPLGNVAQLLIKEKIALAQRIIDLQPFSDLFARYLLTILMSPLLQNSLNKNATGMTAQGIKSARLKLILIPVPPLPEQKRIVAKVDRLLILCDEIEKRQQQRQESIKKMNESAVAQLLSSQNPDDFRQHWQRICNNFDLLYSIPETIPKLRQAILQLAVQGKLDRQDPNDESSSILLKQVKADREQLIKEKKIPKEKPLPPLVESELPYELPDRWNWIRLGEIARLIEYGTSEKASDIGIGVPVLRMNNIRDGKLLFDSLKYVDPLIKDLPRLYLQSGDLLFNRTNSYELVGKTAIFRGNNNQYTFASYLIKVALFLDYVNPEFINLAMNSTYFRQTQIEPEITQQCGQANFNGTKLRNALIPLPPLAEQKRIVAKVDRLMSLCDELENKLKETRSHSEKLMEVTAREVLAV